MTPAIADTIISNAQITTLDRQNPTAQAIAIKDGRILTVGSEEYVRRHADSATRHIDAKGKRIIPGLNDSHTHLIRGGLNYLMELRWDGVQSVATALDMLRQQVAITKAPQWVRVVGGFTEHQFAEKRLPTLEEINAIAPDTPVFILHLYDRALLNGAALRAVGYDKNTPNPPGGEIQRDAQGNPTGLLIARPNAGILYSTLGKGPKLEPEVQALSTRYFMQELNRLGITSVIDAGGGFQNYPDDYRTIKSLRRKDELTVRIAYNLFTQNKGRELDDFKAWTKLIKPGAGDPMYQHNGAGEMLTFSAADFEDFKEPRPDLAESLEDELYGVVKHLVENRWPFRIHGTYEESIVRFLNVFERVNEEIPFNGLHWFIDHAETVTESTIARIQALGGGIAIQHRMAYQGEDFVARYGMAALERTPPVRKMLESGIPVGMGTDATRVASYNPWVGIYWLVTGKSVGGMRMYPPANRLTRMEALRLYTEGSSWFSTENGLKGALKEGQYADLVILNRDMMSIPEDELKELSASLTMVNGQIVFADDNFASLRPAPLPEAPSWSPVKTFGGYQHGAALKMTKLASLSCGCGKSCNVHGHAHANAYTSQVPAKDMRTFWGVLGCACFA